MSLGFEEYVPSGSKLTVFDPRADYSGNTPAQDTALDRNYYGLLIERGAKTAEKKLITLLGGDDAQEQSAHSTLTYFVRELLSGSQLARRLLYRFSFLVIPFPSQQAVRDGYSRYGFDAKTPGVDYWNTVEGGGSAVGSAFITAAVNSWLADHPAPTLAHFCHMQLHCDCINQWARGDAAGSGDPSRPTAPYARMAFQGHVLDSDFGLSIFMGTSESPGYTRADFPELLWPGCILGVGTQGANGATEIFFELPWRSPGSKASFWYRPEALGTLATSMLEGVATVVGANIPLDPVHIIGESSVEVAVMKRIVINVAIAQGVGVSATVMKRAQVAPAIKGGGQVSSALHHQGSIVAAIVAGAVVSSSVSIQPPVPGVYAAIVNGAAVSASVAKRAQKSIAIASGAEVTAYVAQQGTNAAFFFRNFITRRNIQ